MEITSYLDALRRTQPGGETAAFVDFQSGTVLCSSAAIDPQQEFLDALCTTAIDMLSGPAGAAQHAMMLTPTDAVVLQRATAGATEALCLVCAPDSDLETISTAARQTAAEITGSGA